MFDWRADVRKQIQGLGLDPALEWELVEELAQHLQDRYDEVVTSGASVTDARQRVLDELGDGALIASRLRNRSVPPAPPMGTSGGQSWLASLSFDLRYGLKKLKGAPVFTVVCVAMLALGIGASTVMYVYIGTILRAASPPVDLSRQVALWSFNPSQGDPKVMASAFDFVEWQRRATSFDLLDATETLAFNLTGTAEPFRVSGRSVTPGFFELVGARVIHGRPFTADDAKPGAEKVVVIGEFLWRDRFASSPAVLGQEIALDGVRATVIGVVGVGANNSDIFVPLDPNSQTGDASRKLFVMARLRPGVSFEQARAEMTAVGNQLQREYPGSHEGWGVNTRPLDEEYLGPQARIVFSILGGAVLALLLIGCVNVTNLLFAQNLSRRGELALRSVLGASHSRIGRQILAECLLLGLLAGLFGLVLSHFGLTWVRSAMPIPGLDLEQLTVSGRAVVASLGFALASVLIVGLLPLWQLRRLAPADALSDGTVRSTAGRATQRIRSLLVSTEVVLAVLLLVIAGLLIRVLIQFESIADSGFDADNVLTASVTLPENAYSTAAAAGFYERVLAVLADTPGIDVASAVSRVPAAGSRWNPNRSLVVEGRPITPEDPAWAQDVVTTPGYFEALRIPILDGRDFRNSDRSPSPLVAVVNRTMAERYWSGRSPIGARLRLGDEPPGEWRTVVGVVGDVRNDDIDSPVAPHVFLPLGQRPQRQMMIVLRAPTEPESLMAPLKSAIASIDKDLPVYDVRTLRQLLDLDLADSKALIHILGVFAAFALMLAAAGIYSVITYWVSQRTSEIGIRIALGAPRAAVFRLVLAQGLKPVIFGLVIGFGIAFALANAIRGILFQTPPSDPATFGSVSLLFIAAAAVAIAGPVGRALRVDPIRSIRAR